MNRKLDSEHRTNRWYIRRAHICWSESSNRRLHYTYIMRNFAFEIMTLSYIQFKLPYVL